MTRVASLESMLRPLAFRETATRRAGPGDDDDDETPIGDPPDDDEGDFDDEDDDEDDEDALQVTAPAGAARTH